MLIKDLLVLFQGGNEGVCNILEHYFEMSKVDASDSFDIYKSFIKQTDKIVDYLAIARRLNNIVNVPVPNLKHAPTSLVKALDEYLNDPNFEQNRIEYKKSLGVVEGRSGGDKSPAPGNKTEDGKKDEKAGDSSTKPASTPAPPAPVANAQQFIQDFLDSIETEQTTSPQPANATINRSMSTGAMPMNQFGQMPMGQMGPMGSMSTIGSMGPMGGQMPMQMQMTGMANPFRQSAMFPQQTGFMGPQMTGFPNSQQAFMQQPQQQQQPFLQSQPTGFLQPTPSGGGTGMFQPHTPQRQSTFPLASNSSPLPAQPFGQMASDQKQSSLLSQPNQNNPFPLQSQPTGFLQPQTTGSNPFRQSIMPQSTGMGMGNMGGGGGMGGMSGAFTSPSSPFGQPAGLENRPGSTPTNILGAGVKRTDSPKPLVAQKTGSNNPFAPPGGVPAPAPPVPHQPSMNELAQQRFQAQFAAAGGLNPTQTGAPTHQPQQQQQQQQQNDPWNFDPLSSSNQQSSKPSSAMGDIASAFAMDKPKQDDFFSQFSALSTNDTPHTPGAPTTPGGSGFLQPQRTGFTGSNVKPFKPTSNFGAQLEQSLPPIPEPGSMSGSQPVASPGVMTPGANGVSAQSTGFPFNTNFSANGAVASQPTGFQPSSAFGQQFAGGGAGAIENLASPAQSQSQGQVQGQNTGQSLTSQPTGFQPTSNFGQQLAAQHAQQPLQRQNTGSNPFRASMLPGSTPAASGAFGAASPFAGQNMFGQQRQASLF